MSNIVPFDASGWQEAIDGTSALVNGLTYQQGVSAMNNVAAFPSTNGANNIVAFPVSETTEYTTTLQAVYAETLWETAKALGPAGLVTTSLGAAAAGVKSFGTGVFIGDATAAGSLAGTGALATLSLPAAAAAIAPLCGVSLGASLYNLNPELWQKISETLLPWCYDDNWTIGGVVDSLGHFLLPKGAVDALKGLFEDEGIGPSNSSECRYGNGETYYGIYQPVTAYTGSLTVFNPDRRSDYYGQWAFTTPEGCKCIFLVRNTATDWDYMYFVSKNPFSFTISNPASSISPRTITGVQVTSPAGNVYYQVEVYGFGKAPAGTVSMYTLGSWSGYAVGDIVLFGDSTTGGYFPEGTSGWTGTKVDLDSTPTTDVLIETPNGYETAPYYPVTPNVGDPITSPDPLEYPDPTQPLEFPDIVPLFAPQPAPNQWPSTWSEEVPEPNKNQEISPTITFDPLYVPEPSLNPNLNPSLDPSIYPDLVPQPQPTPNPDSAPQSSGVSPTIIFPPTGTTFPSAVPASGGGLVHVYNPTPSQFTSFGNWLWVTYADPSIEKLWNNPFDGVIGAHELYATPSNDGTDTIKSGFLDSGINSTVVRQRYTSINCGSMIIPEYYGNYLDYSPYSKAYVYLPFIGVVEVDVDDIVGHSVNILYHVDSYNGSCIAQITVARDNYTNTVYQFSGNCAVDIPLAGGSQASIRAGLISAAAYGIGSTIQGIISGAAHGGVAGATVGGVNNAIGGIANGIANVVSQKSSVQHSGSFGASYGAMGIKKPYIIIRRPVQKQVTNYNNDYGFPAHKRVTIGTCTGFLRVREVNVVSTLATNDEKKEIENWLKAGVYIE